MRSPSFFHSLLSLYKRGNSLSTIPGEREDFCRKTGFFPKMKRFLQAKFFNKKKESRSGAVFSFYWKIMFLIVGFIRYGRESKTIGSLRSVFGSFSQENTSNRSKAVTGSGFSKKPQRWPNRPRRGSGLGKQRRSSPKSCDPV